MVYRVFTARWQLLNVHYPTWNILFTLSHRSMKDVFLKVYMAFPAKCFQVARFPDFANVLFGTIRCTVQRTIYKRTTGFYRVI